MDQSIIALIRPKFSLAQKEDQAGHLIEHILVESKRLEALGITSDFYARNIIYNNGSINDFYMSEYYVVKSEAADKMAEILLTHKDNLHLDQNDFGKIKTALAEELLADKGEFIDLGEQLAKAIYTPTSPSARYARYNIESAKSYSHDDIINIFNKNNSDLCLMKLSFDHYETTKLPTIEKNILLQNSGVVELEHPWQSPGSTDTFIISTLPEKIDPEISYLYRRSLRDSQFGLLYTTLRDKLGLVYGISIDADYIINTIEVFFATSENNSAKVIDQIKATLDSYESFIEANLEFIKQRVTIDLELSWGDIQTQTYETIDRVISSGSTESPAARIQRINSISAEELCSLNRQYLDLLKNKSLIIKRRHGKKVATL